MPLLLIALLLLTGCAGRPPVTAYVGYSINYKWFGKEDYTMPCTIFEETESVVRCDYKLFKRSEVIVLRVKK